jgi:FkbM family methyltransferase
MNMTEDRAAFVASLAKGAAAFSGSCRYVGGELTEYRLSGHTPFRSFTGKPPGLWSRLTKPSPVVSGVYEPATTYVVSKITGFEKPALAFDMGATGGYFAMVMASHSASRTDVVGYDMMPFIQPAFASVRSANPQFADRLIEGRNVALSDHDGGDKTVWLHKTRLFEHEPKPEEYRESWRRRLKHSVNGEHWKLKLNKLSMPVRTVDTLARECGRDPMLLKIDVDGYEAKVLPGAMSLLKRSRPWIVLEIHRQALLGRLGATRESVIRPLFDIGYSGVMVRGRGALTELIWQRVGPEQFGELETGDTDLMILY